MPAETSSPETNADLPLGARRFWMQWNLRTLFLLTAAVAVWLAYFRFRREEPRLQYQIDTMRKMAHELVIEDKQLAAVVRLPGLWAEDTSWDLHLPDGDYVIRVATRGIASEGLAPSIDEASLLSGRHRIELHHHLEDVDKPSISVLVDKQLLVEATEDTDWYPGEGSLGDGRFGDCRQIPANEPIVLYRCQFIECQSNGALRIPEIANGILLWIAPRP